MKLKTRSICTDVIFQVFKLIFLWWDDQLELDYVIHMDNSDCRVLIRLTETRVSAVRCFCFPEQTVSQ